jgi:hypothetical protein
MEPTDITVEILKDIRAEIRSTNARLETGLADVSRRIVDSEIRTATAITELAGSVHDLTDLLRAGVAPKLAFMQPFGCVAWAERA